MQYSTLIRVTGATALSCLTCAAFAETYTLSFYAEGLKYATFSGVVKEPFVQTGSFLVEANPVNLGISRILDVDLVVDGHRYTVGEIGLLGGSTPTSTLIGGNLYGISTLASRTNDFFLEYEWGAPKSGYFVYASEISPGTGTALDVAYSMTLVPESTALVPEPSELALAAAGLVFAGLATRTQAFGQVRKSGR
jgi:hypothetical protein